MFEKVEELQQRFDEVTSQLGDPDVVGDPDRLRELSKEHSRLQEVVSTYDNYNSARESLEENKVMLTESEDDEMRELIREEILVLEERITELGEHLTYLLTPRDPLDDKNILLEIRAGTGGEEAALFAADLFRMYSRFAETKGWKVEVLNTNATDKGGFREIVALISGDEVYSHLKYESGTHRVQRVPDTESQGRIHTSAATVAILPEAEEVDVDIRNEDLRIDTFRASGAGGQHVNKTESAIRITHIPTGLVVSCQDEKSQHKNKARAMKVLAARLLEQEREAAQASMASDRKDQVGSGDRSERIRTYNYPQSRITDHRINFTSYKLPTVLEGDLEEVVLPLRTHFTAQAMQEQ